MHKITKGLKKKKKGKKSKHKEEELFKPEELEAYRREHNQQHQGSEETGNNTQQSTENEEWKKFNALTSGIDDILKKTQGDLDRIKSTSFFQRVPVQSELKKKELEEKQEVEEAKRQIEAEAASITAISAVEAAIVQVSESESEDDDEDDIFDTAYIDAVASGEIKLAYIPESPTEEPEGDDPFDTRIAERAILGPETVRKGTKLVPIGAAVEILTGRVQAPTCVKRPEVSRREIFKEKDLLLGSFDEDKFPKSVEKNTTNEHKPDILTTLLDEDAPPINEPIDLSISLHLLQENTLKQEVDNDDDDEFAQLAAESLSKPVVNINNQDFISKIEESEVEFQVEFQTFEGNQIQEDELEQFEEDPFDTTFAENILPGKAELKIIENQILNTPSENFTPKPNQLLQEIQQKVKIHLTNPAGQRESISSLDRVSESDLFPIKPIHRDLLGGSNTDLSQVGDVPLEPSESIDENYIEYSDPFDTSVVDTIKPGQTELKFLERELLGDINIKKQEEDDDDFNPRAEEEPDQILSQSRKVSFDLPLEIHEDDGKSVKPLTPYYVRENSIPEIEEVEVDPFDTSFVSDIGIGKVELKLIENELFQENIVQDQSFNPRDEKVHKVVETIRQISDPNFSKVQEKIESKQVVDLLEIKETEEVKEKVLTPSAESSSFDLEYSDPFDTSIASNILPGKTELKLIEKELFNT
ncbi:protein stoned-A [Onthophagus taurus]|uniref:protein stoned-A n=1 Tax=Onthophagus taurus TaxID=166361 RepID=UPI0039BDD2CD